MVTALGAVVLDTNCYIRAMRSEPERLQLRQFARIRATRLWVSSIVLAELRGGVRSGDDPERLTRVVFEPWADGTQVAVPGALAWQLAGDAYARLRGHGDRSRMTRAFAFDVLLAATCAEQELTLVTHNVRDMGRIAEVIPFRFVPPYPGLN
ncbi:MAG: type II toxin-antitoxin system VapC family toxin [Gemmatimonadaceae bacterium]|jgi:predicted nucleic acid-binding protein|nr:type II toxin-antitoxin system VapC family toxin [Gemmatimonadaceae bacterium]